MRRWGSLDAILVLTAVLALWTRTPIGGMGQRAVALVTGDPTEQPSLLAFFRQDHLHQLPELPAVLPDLQADHGTGLPEPWRSAVRYGLPQRLPKHARALIENLDGDREERVLAWLDAHWDGEPEAALERLVVEPALRERAIERARAAGAEHPERFAVHRRYLPQRTEREAASVVDAVLGLAVVFDMQWPVDPGVRISSPFGHRTHPVTGEKGKFHNGVDLPVPVGTPLLAVNDGVVKKVGEDSVSGRYVVLEHDGGITSAFCHLSELPAKQAGERVQKGEVVGLSGNTGRSTGPHLHFVLRVRNRAIDPAPYRRQAGS